MFPGKLRNRYKLANNFFLVSICTWDKFGRSRNNKVTSHMKNIGTILISCILIRKPYSNDVYYFMMLLEYIRIINIALVYSLVSSMYISVIPLLL